MVRGEGKEAYQSWLVSCERMLSAEAAGATPPTDRWRFFWGVDLVLRQACQSSRNAIHRHYRWWIETPETPPVPWRRWFNDADRAVAAGVAAFAPVLARATEPKRPTLGEIPRPPPRFGHYSEQVGSPEDRRLFSELAMQISRRWRPLPPVPNPVTARDHLARYLDEVAERRSVGRDDVSDEQATSNARGLNAVAEHLRDLPATDTRIQQLAEVMANRDNVLLVFGACDDLLSAPGAGGSEGMPDIWITQFVNAQIASWEAEVAEEDSEDDNE